MQQPCPISIPCVPCADGNPIAGYGSEIADVPTALSPLPPQVCVGAAFHEVITITGPDTVNGVKTWALTGTLPPGITFFAVSLNGIFNGVLMTPGVYNFTVSIQGSLGGFVQQAYTVAVGGIINAGTLPGGTAGTAYNYTLATEDMISPAFFIIEGALPAGLAMDGNGNITGTPLATGAGTTSLIFAAYDLNSPAMACTAPGTITITIPSINFNLINWGNSPTLFNGTSPPQSGNNTHNTITDNVISFPVQFSSVGFEHQGTLSYTGPSVVCTIIVNGNIPQQLCGGSPIASLKLQIQDETTSTNLLFITAAVPGTYQFTIPNCPTPHLISIGNITLLVAQQCNPSTSANVIIQVFPAYN